jgi:hypothetical protein
MTRDFKVLKSFLFSFDWSQDVEEEKAKEDDTGMMEDDVGGRAKFWSERKFFKSGDENVNAN